MPRTALKRNLIVSHPRVASESMVCLLSLYHVEFVVLHISWKMARIRENIRPVWLLVRNFEICQLMNELRPWLMLKVV